MKNTDFSSDVKTWLEFASYDIKSAKWQLKGEIYTSSCYAAQQVGEKSLKALILAYGKVIPKVHSMDRLVSILKDLKVNTKKIAKQSLELDKYYITSRYPGQYGGPEGLYDEKDARSAIKSAQAILNFAKKKISRVPKK